MAKKTIMDTEKEAFEQASLKAKKYKQTTYVYRILDINKFLTTCKTSVTRNHERVGYVRIDGETRRKGQGIL